MPLVLAATVAAVWAAPAVAQKRPDLVVSQLANPPLTVAHAGALTATDTVKNSGKARAGTSTTRYYLSRTKAVKGATRLGGARAVKALKPKAAAKGSKRVTVPASVGPGMYHLIACADDLKKVRESNEKNNCRAAARRVEVLPPPTSHGLIEQARRRGEISEEQTLLYTAFAEFGDPRLPDRFRGAPLAQADTDTMLRIRESWATLSPATRAALAPFFVPPFNPASWHGGASFLRSPASLASASDPPGRDLCANTAPDLARWGFKPAADGKVKIWYERARAGQEAKAQAAKNALDDGAWDEVVSLYREPLPDESAGQTCRGGDDALDIALVGPKPGSKEKTLKVGGYAIAYWGDDCLSPLPVFLLLNRDLAGAQLRATLVHELAHATHYAYAADWCAGRDHSWLTEATATWTEDHVYRGSQLEHPYAWDFLRRPHEPLETHERPGDRTGRQYGAYLFFLFLAHDKGINPERVADVWEQTEALGDSLDGVHKVLSDAGYGGGFRDAWKRFSLLLVNKPPVENLKQWDNISVGVNPGLDLFAMMHAPETRELKIVGLPHLASDYERFLFMPSVREVVVKNPFVGVQGASVQAWLRLANGQRRVDDLTDKPEKVYCRDVVAENVEEMILVFGNSTHADRVHQLEAGTEPRVETKTGCSLRGTASGTVVADWYDAGQHTYTWSATFELEYMLGSPHPEQWYRAVAGQLTWGMTGDAGNCVWNIPSRTYVLSPFTAGGPRLFVHPSQGKYELEVQQVILDPANPMASLAPGTVTCPGDPPEQITFALPFSTTGLQNGTLAALPLAGSRNYVGSDLPGMFTERVSVTWNVGRG